MSADPVGNTLVVNVEQSAYGSVAGAFEGEFQSLLSYHRIMTTSFTLECEIALTVLAAVSL